MTKPNKIKELKITQSRVKELLNYNPLTGNFTWIVNRGSAKIGYTAGRKDTSGYIQISIDGRRYMAHRLAWLYIYGTWPADEIDHKYRDRANNRIEDLRPAEDYEQLQNISTRNDNTSGYIGVKKHGRKKNRWQASIQVKGTRHYLGTYAAEEANFAYSEAKIKYHKFNLI